MKKAFLIFTIMFLVGCLIVFSVMFTCRAPTEGADEIESEYVPVHFSKISETTVDGFSYDIVVHVETGVLYVHGIGQLKSGLTVILNADGTPMTYDQFKK